MGCRSAAFAASCALMAPVRPWMVQSRVRDALGPGGDKTVLVVTDRRVPADKLMETALEWAETICKNGPLAVRTAKEIAVRALALEPGFVLEKAIAPRVLNSEDAKEGPRAFLEKRAPNFKGK